VTPAFEEGAFIAIGFSISPNHIKLFWQRGKYRIDKHKIKEIIKDV